MPGQHGVQCFCHRCDTNVIVGYLDGTLQWDAEETAYRWHTVCPDCGNRIVSGPVPPRLETVIRSRYAAALAARDADIDRQCEDAADLLHRLGAYIVDAARQGGVR